jgi:hypothetical protein
MSWHLVGKALLLFSSSEFSCHFLSLYVSLSVLKIQRQKTKTKKPDLYLTRFALELYLLEERFDILIKWSHFIREHVYKELCTVTFNKVLPCWKNSWAFYSFPLLLILITTLSNYLSLVSRNRTDLGALRLLPSSPVSVTSLEFAA